MSQQPRSTFVLVHPSEILRALMGLKDVAVLAFTRRGLDVELVIEQVTRRRCAKQTTERFADYGQAPVYSTPGDVTSLTVIGDKASGLWTMQWAADGDSQDIVSIDPATGSESTAATVLNLQEPLYTDEGLAQGQAVYFDGALYLLEPPFRFNG